MVDVPVASVRTLRLPRGRRRGTEDDVRTVLRARWHDGIDLTELALGSAWSPLVVPLRAPTAAEYADDFEGVRAWSNTWLSATPGLRVDRERIGGRRSGTLDVPSRVIIDTREQLWQVLRVRADVRTFEDILALVQQELPAASDWVARHPHRAIALSEQWNSLVATVRWIVEAKPPGAWVRQVDIPGVDTKFIERHRDTLAALLDTSLPPSRIDLAHPRSSFARRYGFTTKPAYARMRRPDGNALYRDLPVSELTMRVDELTHIPLAGTIFVVENEVTYHAFPAIGECVVFLGAGYGVSQLTGLDWLDDRDVVYWGDIDTHGFVMLDRLRRRFPHVRSMLMDRATLLAHRAHWGHEDEPVNVALDHLDADESALYVDLVEDRYAQGLRLEQERIRFGSIRDQLERPR